MFQNTPNPFLRLLRTLLLTFLSLLAVLLLTEFLLRHSSLKDAHAPMFGAPEEYYAYNAEEGMIDIVQNVGTTTHHTAESSYDVWSNSDGCFDTPFATGTTPYIYLTGDSFVWGYTPFGEKIGTVTEDLLGVRVAKCGLASVGTAQELRKASSTIKKIGNPSLIVVGYHGGTDPGDDVWFERHKNSREVFPSRWTCEATGKNIFIKTKCFLDTHSVLYNVIETTLRTKDVPFLSKSTASRFFFLPYPTADPSSEEEWKIHERSILGFKSLAEVHGAELLFVLIPSQREIYSEATVSLSNAKAKEILEKQGVRFLDLFPGIQSFAREQSLPLYWRGLVPFTPEGNRVAGELISEYIKEENLILAR